MSNRGRMVIIGAGINGLVAANLAQRSGVRAVQRRAVLGWIGRVALAVGLDQGPLDRRGVVDRV